MLTTLSIMSLDQGRELARRRVANLYTQPGEPASDVIVARAAAKRSAGRSPHSHIVGLLDTLRPIGVWRL